MTMHLTPDSGVPIPKSDPKLTLPERVEAGANTASELGEHGLAVAPTKEDKEVAAALASLYAENPENTSKKVTTKRAATLTPASLILANSILKEFGQAVVETSLQIRHLVTNKLILEAENPDPRIRIRALELLGKISDVGLFAEKSEITVTHQSTDDLRDRLRSKMARLVNPEPEAEVEDAIILDGEPINLDDEFGALDD